MLLMDADDMYINKREEIRSWLRRHATDAPADAATDVATGSGQLSSTRSSTRPSTGRAVVQGVSYDDTFIDVTRVDFVAVDPVGSVDSVDPVDLVGVDRTDAVNGHRRRRQSNLQAAIRKAVQTTNSSPPSALPSDLLQAASFAVGLRRRLSAQFGMRFSIGVGRAKLTSKLAGALAKPNKGHHASPCSSLALSPGLNGLLPPTPTPPPTAAALALKPLHRSAQTYRQEARV